MARQCKVTYRTGALLLLLLCVTCVFTSRSSATDRDGGGVRAHGLVHVVKGPVYPQVSQSGRGLPDDTAGGTTSDLTQALALGALLIAMAVAVLRSTLRRRPRLVGLATRAPPGSYALA